MIVGRHPVQSSSVCGTLRLLRTFIFSLGQLRSIERFRTLKAKCRIGWDGIGLGYPIPLCHQERRSRVMLIMKL